VDKTKVRYLINSDAHSVDRIGDTKIVDTILERVKIDLSRVDNIEGRLPNLRFRAFKNNM